MINNGFLRMIYVLNEQCRHGKNMALLDWGRKKETENFSMESWLNISSVVE